MTRSVLPDQVDNLKLDAFETWLGEANLEKPTKIKSLARGTASGWEWARASVPGWPQEPLFRLNMKVNYTRGLCETSPEFQADAQVFLGRLATRRPKRIYPPGADKPARKPGPRSLPKPLKQGTIDAREYQIRQAVAALEASGIPLESLTSLRDLVDPPERVETILYFHVERVRARHPGKFGSDEEVQTTGLAGIGEVLRQIAVFHCQMPEEDLAMIQEFQEAVTPLQQMTMNPEIVLRLRVLFEPHNYGRLINYPAELMKAARKPGLHPEDAARLVMFAVAIEILLFMALRRQNLVGLHLDVNLKELGPNGIYGRIFIAESAVKGMGKFIDLPITPSLARLLAIFIKDYRPLLAKPGNRWLFPGLTSGHRDPAEFGTAISHMIERDLGVRFNPHLARHFAAVRYIRDRPGRYSVVSRLLGHANIETTRRYYASFLDADAAATEMNASLIRDREATRQIAALAARKKAKATPAKPKDTEKPRLAKTNGSEK